MKKKPPVRETTTKKPKIRPGQLWQCRERPFRYIYIVKCTKASVVRKLERWKVEGFHGHHLQPPMRRTRFSAMSTRNIHEHHKLLNPDTGLLVFTEATAVTLDGCVGPKPEQSWVKG